jgi:hypothetical protein
MLQPKNAGMFVLYACGVVVVAALARIGWELGAKIWMLF